MIFVYAVYSFEIGNPPARFMSKGAPYVDTIDVSYETLAIWLVWGTFNWYSLAFWFLVSEFSFSKL